MPTRMVLAIGLFVTFTTSAFAQGTATTYHVFPQIADGRFPDGTYYVSILFATNTAATDANCTYRLYGLGEDRAQIPSPFVLPAFGGFIINPTRGAAAPFASGYATLSCDQPVSASVLYQYGSASGTLGLATVFSAARSFVAQYPVLNSASGFRLGLAIANDTDTAEQYFAILANNSGAEVARVPLTIQPRTTVAKFVNELFTIPNGFAGSVAIASAKALAGTLGGEFRTVGLLFLGTTFSTMLPAVFLP